MATLYARGLEPLPKSEATTRLTRVPMERYYWPLAFAVVCLLLEFMLRGKSPAVRAGPRSAPPPGPPCNRLRRPFVSCSQYAAGGPPLPAGAFSDYQSGRLQVGL